MSRPHRLVRAKRPRQNLWRQLNKPRQVALGSFSHKSVIIGFILVGVIMLGLWTYQSPTSILWHSYTTVADPTTPIMKYTAPNADTSEFNTHGNVSYATCYIDQACLRLQASPIFPNGNMSIPSIVVYPGAPVNSTVFNTIAGFPGNNTIFFDVTGKTTGLTLIFLITTTAPSTLTFAGAQSNSLICTCTLSYSNGENVLSFISGQTFTTLLISWTAATSGAAWQQNFGGYALAESKVPVGDLSVAVSKELEFMANLTMIANHAGVGNCCANDGGNNPDYNWGFFLTTNKNLWQNGDPNWDPLNDPDIQLFAVMKPLEVAAGPKVSNVVYVQRHVGETLLSEDTLGCSGSAYLCAVGVLRGPNYAWLNLNFTASSNAPQVGSNVCPVSITTGGPGCSYFVHNNGIGSFGTNSTVFPGFQLTSSTYYAGFFMGSKQIYSVNYCFDKGKCAKPVIPIANAPPLGSSQGCSGASMEIDFCVPSPSTNNPQGVTDSGGFFGAVGRFLGSTGNFIVGGATGVFNTILSPIANALPNLEGVFSSAINIAWQAIIFSFVTVLNQVGSWIGLGGNLGTNIVSFFSSVSMFISGLFGAIFAQLGNVATAMLSLFLSIGSLLGNYWTDLTVWITALAGILAGFWNVVSLGLGFGIGAGFIIFWIYGIFEALEGFDRWQGWTALLLQIVMMGINLMLWLLAIVWNRILFPMIQAVKGWL